MLHEMGNSSPSPKKEEEGRPSLLELRVKAFFPSSTDLGGDIGGGVSVSLSFGLS